MVVRRHGLHGVVVGEQADREVALIRQRGEEQLERQREQVKRELSAEIGQLAVTLAERIVGESMQDETSRRGTVDRFIAELEGMPTPEGGGSADAVDAGAEPAPATRKTAAKGGRGGSGGRRKP